MNIDWGMVAQNETPPARMEWGDLYGDGVDFAVNRLIEEWCSDPQMWGTHGIPGEVKLARLQSDITALCRKLRRA